MKKCLLFVAALFCASMASAALFQGWESGTLDNWTTIDADGDGNNWYVLGGDMKHHTGDYSVTSASYYNSSALTPDNYLVSPKVELGGKIIFWAIGQDASYCAEHFAVAVSVAGNTAATDFEVISQEFVATSEYQKITVDLSAFANMEGYVAIRHYNVTDMFRLNIDDITILAPGETETEDIPTTSVDNKATKTIKNGTLLIHKNGQNYTVTGQEVK